MLLALASVTDSLVNLATHLIRDIGLTGVAVLTLTSGIVGLIGDVLGASVAYGIGYFGSRELFERRGRRLHMSAERLDRAHGWFERYGLPTIVVSRVVPVARFAVPYAAGVARMPFLRFLTLVLIGSIPWIAGLGLLGRAVGSSWPNWRHNLEYVDYVGAALVVAAIAYLIVRHVRGGGGRPTPDVAG